MVIVRFWTITGAVTRGMTDGRFYPARHTPAFDRVNRQRIDRPGPRERQPTRSRQEPSASTRLGPHCPDRLPSFWIRKLTDGHPVRQWLSMPWDGVASRTFTDRLAGRERVH